MSRFYPQLLPNGTFQGPASHGKPSFHVNFRGFCAGDEYIDPASESIRLPGVS